ncbi:MAG TPA: alpha/beta hydrolase [Pyrinomonadaceae bacterium]|jgi:alpha-beta hydrolase superfamily lysophospholipase|nr:alpha/beta hydrolase [Pyrinomonadaceae bacterium]
MENEGTFEGVGGLKIATRTWLPEGTVRGIMILVHGFNSHSGYMRWPAEQFAAQGLAAYALDHRGRGKSEGERFYVEKFSDWLEDVDKLVDISRSENPGVPVYMLGHSAGGVIASSYVFEHQQEIAGLVCESFAYDVGLPHLAQLALEGASHLIPHLPVYSLKNEIFSRDPAVVEAMNNDPLIKNESQPAQTSSELLKAAERLGKNMPNFNVPVFIIHGTDDKATRPAGSQYFYDNVGSKDKTLKLYEGGYHDLLNDIDKELVMADILAWVSQRIPAKTAAA